MLEYCAREALVTLQDEAIRNITPNADWYLDLVQSTWFPGWEDYWREMCNTMTVDPTREVLAAFQVPGMTALWFTDNCVCIRYHGYWFYASDDHKRSPHRICRFDGGYDSKHLTLHFENGNSMSF